MVALLMRITRRLDRKCLRASRRRHLDEDDRRTRCMMVTPVHSPPRLPDSLTAVAIIDRGHASPLSAHLLEEGLDAKKFRDALTHVVLPMASNHRPITRQILGARSLAFGLRGGKQQRVEVVEHDGLRGNVVGANFSQLMARRQPTCEAIEQPYAIPRRRFIIDRCGNLGASGSTATRTTRAVGSPSVLRCDDPSDTRRAGDLPLRTRSPHRQL
jgi:hypothetical protein